MNWLAAVVNALLTGAFGLVSAGVLANACVSWHNVSTREGAAGYFVVLLALLGAAVGAALGFGVTYAMGPSGFGESSKALGVSIGAAALAVGLATAVSYWLADVPPKVGGRELSLDVEFRLPTGEDATAGAWRITLGSLEGGRQRASTSEKIAVAQARDEDGRCVVPASILLFTQRGERLIHLQRDADYVASFLAPIPARPGVTDWSDWLPRQAPDGSPWPASSVSYRFRLRPIAPPSDPPDPAVAEAARLAELAPDAPLTAWLGFLRADSTPERIAEVMDVVNVRKDELAALITGPYVAGREMALDAVPMLDEITPQVRDAVAAEGGAIAEALRELNASAADDPLFAERQSQLPGRFNHYKRAWWTTARRLGEDPRPPVREILELAQVRAAGTSLAEIVVNARVILDALDEPSGTR